MRTGLLTLLVFVSCLAMTSASSSELHPIIDERFSLDTKALGINDGDYSGLSINGYGNAEIDNPSWLGCGASKYSSNFLVIKDMGSESCRTSKVFKFHSILKVCHDELDINCVDSLFIEKNGSIENGKFVKYVSDQSQNTFLGDSAKGIPDGLVPGLWTFSSIGEDKYFLLDASLTGIFTSSQEKLDSLTFNADIFRTSPVADSGVDEPKIQSIGQSASFNRTWTYNPNRDYWIPPSCAILTKNMCYMKEKLPLDARLGLTIRTNNHLSGWFHGRVGEGQVSVAELNSISRYSFLGFPTKIPLILGYTTIAKSPSNKSLGVVIPDDPGSDSAMLQLEAWLPVLQNKAQAAPSIWRVSALDYDPNPCMRSSDKILGLVSTNSATYSPGAPYWDSVDRELKYKLVSPHLLPDGTTFKGEYTLQINPQVARCLYGFSGAPIKASINVSYENGTSNVATTTISENQDWITLRAAGFEFSSPEVKVKFSQEIPKVESPPIVKKTSNNVTLICVKGTRSRTIIGLNPKCPYGYKIQKKAK